MWGYLKLPRAFTPPFQYWNKDFNFFFFIRPIVVGYYFYFYIVNYYKTIENLANTHFTSVNSLCVFCFVYKV